MPREAPEIRLIRETLEGVLHPSTASTLLFEALAEHGGTVPTTHAEILSLVRGPVATRLTDRLGEDMTQSLLDQLTMMLGAIAPPPSEGGRPVRRRPSRHEEQTRNVELSSETLPVFVLSSSREFSAKLSAALGPHVMSTVHVADAAMLRERIDQIAPAFVLVNASDFPAIEPRELVEQLAALPADLVKAIWGADLPYGMSVIAAAQAHGVHLTPFDRGEGIAPLMDMIRSRRAS